ncbi:hypothetical protein [Desulfosarcina variabilis]|uniref:hypothetical protein n=1 Tax=Desulfosarcina variabilis TaxID=2300 RepID=UPI003AFAF797
MQKKKDDLEIKIQLFGWILFIICALLFMAASLKNQDVLTFAGSLIFLVACIVFLIPLVKRLAKK